MAAGYGEINVTTANCVEWSTNLSDNVSIITGDIVVTSGTLNLSNATIEMNCAGNGQYEINVTCGGVLNLANNSLVTANNTNYRYNWWYRSGSSGSLTGCTIEYCGYDVGSYGLKIETDGMTLDSCTVRYNYYGIFLSSSDNTVITNTTANENTKYGIYLSSSHSNNITGCTANSNGRSAGHSYYGSGIHLENSNNNTLSENTANSNKQYGIYAGSCNNSTLTNNTASSNSYQYYTTYGGTGICLSSNYESTLFNNTVSNNRRCGIYLDSSEDCDLQSNNITENTCYGLYVKSKYNSAIDQSNTVNGKKVYYYYNYTNINIDTNDAGHITIANCTHFNVTDNVIDGGDGIRIIVSSNITISNNTLLNNYHGIELSNSSYNNLTNNNASNNDYSGIYLISSESNNLTNNTADENTDSGFCLISSNSNDLSNNTASSNLKGACLESSENNNITNSTISDNVYGYYITSSSNNTLTNNSMTGNTNSGLYVLYNYDNAIDPYSNTVDGEPVHYYYNYTSVEIKNNSLNAYNVSNLGRISLIDCADFVVINNTMKNRYHGIYLDSSDNISITENDLTVIGGNGVHIAHSNNNTLHGITASNCNSSGIHMLASHNNTISDCITNSNEKGIDLSRSKNNTLTNNTACSNTYYGFYLDGSDYNTFVNNTACFSTDYSGVCLRSSDHISFSDGNVSNNGDHGFQIGASSSYTTIVNTSVCSNGDRGIMLESDHNNISDNNISYNGGNGLHLSYSDYNEVDRNTISNNSGRGTVFAASNNNNATWNNILNNSDNGVRFTAPSRFNELVANTIAGNGVYDVYILSSNNNTITRTKAQLNDYDFYFDGSTDACIFDTVFDDARYKLIESANLTVGWYLDVWVTDSLHIKSIAGSSVAIRYNETGGNAMIFSGMVGSDGRLSSYYDTLPAVIWFNASPGARTDYGLYANATTATNQTGYNDTGYQVTGQGATLIITTGWTVNTRCYYCHEDKKTFELTQHANGTIGSDARNCTYCHNATDTEAIPHGRSSGPDLLAAPSPRLCYNGSDGASGGSCHGVGSPYGDQYTEFRSTTAHPVNDGNMSCATCHDNHGFSAEYSGSMEKEEYRTADYDLKSYYYTGSEAIGIVFGSYRPEEFELCYTCHLEENLMNETSQKTNFWSGDAPQFGYRNQHALHTRDSSLENVLSGCRNCHNPHGSPCPRMNRNVSLYTGGIGGFFCFINNSVNPAYELADPDDWDDTSLNKGGAISPGDTATDYCSSFACHGAGSEPYNPTVAWVSYPRDLLPIVPTGGPNCTGCHDRGYSKAIRPIVNVTAMKLGMHAGVNSDCDITYWAGVRGFDASNVSDDNRICWGCHATNGTPPYQNYHPDRTLNPYKCAKCHGEYQPLHVNVSDPDITHSAAIIKNHGPTTTGRGSIRIQTDLTKGGSCEDCHYPSRITDIGVNTSRYDTTIIGNSSHYGLNSTGGMLMTLADDSTSCTYCHCNETNSIFWGNATVVDMRAHSGGVSSNQECYGCHVIGNHPEDPVEDLVIPGNFHNETLYSGGGPDCIVCHDVGNMYGFTETNVTSVNLGIHRNVTKNAYEQIDVDDRSKSCWGCHQSDGVQPEGMGDRYDNPWRCEDCHTPSAAWNAATNNGYTWSADGSPLPPTGIVEHAPSSTDVRTNVTGNGTCVDCHNNSIDPHHNDTGERLLGNTIYANISHYGMPVGIDTLNCLYCHNSADGTTWGGATQIYIGGTADMYDATSNTECYACHIDYSVAMPDNFHKNSLNWGGGPNCTSCHDTSSNACFNAGFGVDSGVNVTSVAATSVHRNVNQNATDPGSTWTQEDWGGGVGSATDQYNASLNTSSSDELQLDTVPCEEDDTFTDTSEIASSHTVTISGGDVNLSAGNLTGNLTSTVIAPGKLGCWGIFHANDTLNWKYKRAVTIENTAGLLIDHQVRIDVSYDSDMKSDFSDIRFTDSDGDILHYWVEEYTSSTSAVVWVRIPSISSQKTIYVHYGNPSAVSKSSIQDTFLFGDDFRNATLTNASINKFTHPSKQYVESGMYHISGLAGEETIAEINLTQFPDDYIVEVVVRWIDSTNGSICISPRYQDRDDRYISSFNNTNVSISKVVSGVRSNLAIGSLVAGGISTDIGYTFRSAIRNTATTNEITILAKLADLTVGSVQTTDSSLNYEKIAFSGAGSDTFHIHLDDLRVRRYGETEPTTSIGAEETGDEIIYEILDSSNNKILSVSDGSYLSSIDADAIRIKATLETTNASFTPTLHDWNVTWYHYKIDGNLTSAAHSTGENYNFSTISWTGQVPDDTGVRFRLRSGATESALYVASWYGPTGTGDYYTASDTKINSIHDDDQWVQYRAYLNTTDGNHTSTLYDVSITHTTSYHQYYTFDPRNKICWACHDTDGEYVGAMGDRYDQPWDCANCHIQYGTRWSTWTDASSPPLVVEHQPDAPGVQTNVLGNGTCADCHNNSIDQYHDDTREAIIGNTLTAIVSHYALNKSFGRLLTASNNTTDCVYCHYTDDTTASKWGNATNITLGQNFVHGTDLASDIYTNNSRCYDCHVTTKEIPEKPYFHSETLLLGGGPDCIACHDTGMDATNINATSIGSGMHGGLSDIGVSQYQQSVSCWACHGDGTQPTAHPENVRDPIYCGYCHATPSGYAYASLFGSPPRVYDHIPEPYTQDVRTNITGAPNGTCEYCHDNSIDPYHNDADESLIGNTMLANVSHYGLDKTSGMLMTASNNTTDCLYCHNNTPNNITWGSAKIVTHKQDYNNSDCYGCHDTTGTMPATFHAEHMSSGGGGDCIECHDIGGSAEHRINVTAVNSGVHANINNNASNSTAVPASNKKCWGCHQSDGTEPTTDMGDIVSTPYQCRDCHNGTVPHINLSTATGVHEHFKSGAEIQALQNEDNDTESCLSCHNMSEMKVNYAEDDSYGNTISYVSHYARNYTELASLRDLTNSTKYCQYCHDNSSVIFDPFIDSSCQNITHGSNCSLCHGAGKIHDAELGSGGGPDCLRCHGRTGLASSRRIDETVFETAIHGSVNSAASDLNRSCWACHFENGTNASEHSMRKAQPYLCYDCHNKVGAPFGNVSGAPSAHNHFMSGTSVEAYRDEATDSESCMRCHNQSEMFYPFDENDTYLSNFSIASHYGDNRTDIVALYDPADSTNYCQYCHRNSSTPFIDRLTLKSINHRGSASCDECHGNGMLHSGTLTRVSTAGSCTDCHALYGDAQPGMNYKINVSAMNLGVHADVNENMTAIAAVAPINDTNNAKCWGCHVLDGEYPEDGHKGTLNNDAYLCYDCHNGTAAYQNVTSATAVYNHFKSGNISACTTAATDSESCGYGCHNLTSMKVPGFEGITGTSGYRENMSQASHYTMNRSDDIVLANDLSDCAWCHKDSENEFAGIFEKLSKANIAHASETTSCITLGCHNKGRIHDLNLSGGDAGPDCLRCHGRTGLALNRRIDETAFATAIHGDLNNATNESDLNRSCRVCHFEDGLNADNHTSKKSTPYLCYDCHNKNVAPLFANVSAAPNAYNHFLNGTNVSAYWNEATDSESCMGCHNQTGMFYAFDENDTYLSNFSITSHYGNNRTDIVSLYNESDSTAYCAYCHINESSPFFEYPNNRDIQHTGTQSCDDCHGIGRLHNDALTRVTTTANCTDCHALYGVNTTQTRYHINVTAVNLGVHAGVNSNMNTTAEAEVADVNNAKCWGCHVPGGAYPADGHGDIFNNDAYLCYECHNGTAAYQNVTSATAVYNHYKSGTNIRARTVAETDSFSCGYGCHNLATMKVPGFNAGENATYRVNMSQASHYTRDRPDIANVTGGYSDCGYCHLDLTNEFADIFENSGLANISHASETTSCITQGCHNKGRIHDLNLSGGDAGPDCLKCHSRAGPAISRRIDETAFKIAIHGRVNDASTNLNRSCWACHFEDGLNADNHTSKKSTPYLCYDCHNKGNPPFTNVSNAPNAFNHYKSGSSIQAYRNEATDSESCMGCHDRDEMKYAFDENDAYSTSFSITSHYGDNRTDLVSKYGASDSTEYCAYCHINTSSPFFEYPDNKDIQHAGNQGCNICHGDGRLHNETLTRVETTGNCTDCHALYGDNTTQTRYHINVSAMNLGVHAGVNSNMAAIATSEVADANNAKCWGCHVPDGAYPADGHGDIFNNRAYLCYDCHNGTAAYVNVESATAVYNHFRSGDITARTGAETDSASCGYGCHSLTSMKVPGFDASGNASYLVNMSQASHYTRSRPDIANVLGGYSDCTFCHKNSTNEFAPIFERPSKANISHASETESCITQGCHNKGRIHDMSLSRGDAGSDCIRCHGKEGIITSRRIDEDVFATAIHGRVNGAASDLNRSCWACHFENGMNADSHPNRKSPPYLCYDCHNKVGAPFANVSNAPNAFNHYKGGTGVEAYWDCATDSESCMGCHNQSEMNYAFNENDTYATNFSITSHYGNNRTDLVSKYGASNSTAYCAYCHINESSPFFEYPNNRDIQHTGTQSCDDCHGIGRLHNDALTRVTTTANCTDCHALYGVNTTQTRYHINVTAVNLGVHAGVNSNMNATSEAEVADVNNAKCWGCHVPGGKYPADGHGDIFNNDAYLCYECHNGTAAYQNVTSATAVYNHFKEGANIKARTVAETNSYSCGYGCHNRTSMKVPGFNAGENATYRVNMSQASHYTRDRPDIANVTGGYSDCGWCHLDSTNEFIAIFEDPGLVNITHASQTRSCIVEGCHNRGRIHDLNLTFPDWDLGRECANCHLSGGANTSGIVAIINKTGFERSVHTNITGDYNSSNYTAISRVCWGCHNNYTEQANDPKKHAEVKPDCEDCHGSASPQNMGNLSENLRQVTEHQPNGTDITTNGTIASCIICHNRSLVTGMPPSDRVVTRTPQNFISHYGRQRTDMIEGAVTNCSYCHCDEANSFSDTFDNANNTNITHGGSSTGCTGCHGDGRFHDAALSSPMMAPGNNSLCMNTACHGNNQKSWFVDAAAFTTLIHGSINCTDCHVPLPVSFGGGVSAGGTHNHSFTVDADVKRLNVTLNWAAGILNLTLDANGTEINQTMAAGNSSIDYNESGTTIRYTIENPASGSWIARITDVSATTTFSLDIEFIQKHPKTRKCFANPCESCHVTDISYDAPPVAEHVTRGTATGAGVWTNASCAACHANDIVLPSSLGGSGVNTGNNDAMTAHYGSHLSFDTAECIDCHEDDDISAKWAGANDPRNFTRHETVRKVLRTGKVWKLKNEYEIVVGPVSSSGSSIRVNLMHDGAVVKGELVTVGGNFEYEVNGLSESGDVVICNLTVSNIFAAGLWGVVTFDGTVLASRVHIETANEDCYACHISGYRYGADDGDEYLVLRNDGCDVTIGKLPINFTERERRIFGVGYVWDLGHEYTLTVAEVDLLGGKARLELALNGTVLQSEVVEEGGVFMYNTTMRDRKGHVINDVTVFQVRVAGVFRR
jgi:parallel beta-helix repeat protein